MELELPWISDGEVGMTIFGETSHRVGELHVGLGGRVLAEILMALRAIAIRQLDQRCLAPLMFAMARRAGAVGRLLRVVFRSRMTGLALGVARGIALLCVVQEWDLPGMAADRRKGRMAGGSLRIPLLVDAGNRAARGVDFAPIAQHEFGRDPTH